MMGVTLAGRSPESPSHLAGPRDSNRITCVRNGDRAYGESSGDKLARQPTASPVRGEDSPANHETLHHGPRTAGLHGAGLAFEPEPDHRTHPHRRSIWMGSSLDLTGGSPHTLLDGLWSPNCMPICCPQPRKDRHERASHAI